MSEIKTETVYVTDTGPKRLSEMTREELIVALEATARELWALRAQARRDMDLLFGNRL